MRKPKALVVPFKFREGYPDSIVDSYIDQAGTLIDESGIEFVLSESVTFDEDADLVNKKYNIDEFDFVVCVMPTWFEPGTFIRAVKNFLSVPIIVWGFSNFIHNGERVNLGSSAGAGAAKGSLRELGTNHEYIYYSPGIGKDDLIKSQLTKVANVARAISLMSDARILTIGYLFGGMTLGDMDLTRMRSVFGPDLVELDNYTFIQRVEAFDINSDEYKSAREEVVALLNNDPSEKLEKIVRMYAVLKEFVSETRSQAITLKCHFVLSQEYGFTPCVPLSVIGNLLPTACEADIPVILTQLLMHYLSGGQTTAYADTHELVEDRVLLAACGYAPASMCMGGKITCALPTGEPTALGATFKDYITNENHLKAGFMTAARILKEPDGGFSLHCATGTGKGDVGKVSELGAPQYAFTEMKLDGKLESFAQNLGSHHYALIYEDLVDELELFCKYKKISMTRD